MVETIRKDLAARRKPLSAIQQLTVVGIAQEEHKFVADFGVLRDVESFLYVIG